MRFCTNLENLRVAPIIRQGNTSCVPFLMAFHAFVTTGGAKSHDLACVRSRGHPRQEPAQLGGLGQLIAPQQLGDVSGPRSRTTLSQGSQR